MIPNPLTSSTFSRNSPVLADLHAKRVSQTGATRFATCFWSTLARGVRWISTFTYASAIALLAAVASQLLGGSAARSWFLLVWAILLLFVVIGLFGHPMRWPAWGLFVGFWGVVGALFLIVLQALGPRGRASRTCLWHMDGLAAGGGWDLDPGCVGPWLRQ